MQDLVNYIISYFT